MTATDNRKISELGQLTSLPSGAMVPVAYQGRNYRVPSDLFRNAVLDVTDFGVSASNAGAANDTGITLAITTALAQNAELYWPYGTYPSAGSNANFHSVRHRGPGRILRGSDTFYVEPKSGQTNRLYVATTGSAGNDGLSAAQPMLTAAGLFSALGNYGPVLDGTWHGIFAAGTYVTTNASFATPSRNLVTFRGPDPGGTTATPTVIFSGSAAGASDFGIRSTGIGVQCLWQDLLFDGYDASANNICLLADYGSSLWTHNVHCTNSTGQGIYGEDCPVVRITGGIIDGCRQGILLNACNMVTVGYQHSAATDGIVRNCTQCGVEWSRGTNGHLDYMTLESNAVGLEPMHVSRVHVMGCAFTSNTIGVRSRSGGYWLDDTGVTNTFTTNTRNAVRYANSGETDSDLWVSIQERRRAYSANSVTHTGTVAKTTILSPWTIPQNFFITPSANASLVKIRVVLHGTFVTAAALSQIGVDFDSVVIANFAAVAPGANTPFRLEVEIWADGNAAQFKSATLYQHNAVPQVAMNSPAQNMANAARNINITSTLANAGDSLRLDRTEVWVAG